MLQKKLQNFENRRVDQVDVNNYNYLENAYFVMLFPSVSPPPPFPAHRWARFARRFISYLTPFFAFFPYCGAWSKATQMVSQLQTQLTMSLVPEVHPHIRAGLTSVCLLIPLMLWNHYDFIFRVISLISVFDFFLRLGQFWGQLIFGPGTSLGFLLEVLAFFLVLIFVRIRSSPSLQTRVPPTTINPRCC